MPAWFALLGAALAAEVDVRVVPERATLAPGLPERVWVAVAVDGEPPDRAPTVDAVGGSVRFASSGGSPGVWPLIVVPDPGVPRVELSLAVAGVTRRESLPVDWPAASSLSVPERVDGVAQGEPVRIPVTGPDVPPPEHLQVAVGEGTVLGIEVVQGGLEIVVQPDDSPFPRAIPFGVRDARTADRPLWGAIRLRARPRIPLDLEPGATVRIELGGRTYGPLTANAEGEVVARIDQYPGETTAEAVLTDDLGNRTTFAIPMTAFAEPSLVALVGEGGGPEGRPRLVYLHAVLGTGAAWRGDAPKCRSAAMGAVDVLPMGSGAYAVPLDGRVAEDLLDVRLECQLGSEVSTAVRASAPVGVARRVLLRVWPTDLSTDLPVAEVRVALEDARGQRLPVDDVRLYADRGVIALEEGGVGEYDGAEAVPVGEDVIVARYEPRPTRGPVVALELAWEQGPSGGLNLSARASDRGGRPVEGAEIVLSAEDVAVTALTDAHGWASAEVSALPGSGPIVLEARAGGVLARRPTLRGRADGVQRTDAALEARQGVSLAPGRVAGISIDIDPPILRTGRGAVAWVTVVLEDRSGRPLADPSIALEVSEGTIGPLVARPDGTWLAEYQPSEEDRAREVTLTARTDSVRSTARLSLEPRLGRLSLGPTMGWITNFGAVSSPTLGVDADVRTALLAETVVLRFGVSGHTVVSRAATGIGEDVEIRGGVFPGLAAVLIRRDRGGLSGWGGAGGVLGLQTQHARFGPTLVSSGNRVVSGGALIGGLGYRAGLGDLVAEARYLWIPATGGELGFTGNLGGLSVGVGFRLVY